MAVIPELVINLPKHTVEIHRYPMMEDLSFYILINGINLGSAVWIPNNYWQLSQCSITIQDIQDVILPALRKHILANDKGLYYHVGMNSVEVNNEVYYLPFQEEILSY